MMLSRLSLVLALFIIVFPTIANATVPGNPCTVGQTNATMQSGGPETSGVLYLLKCNGTTWEAYMSWGLEYATEGAFAVVSNDPPAAKGMLDGTQNPYPDDEIVYSGIAASGWAFIGATGASSSLTSGLWNDGYETWIGQSYSPEAAPPMGGDFSGFRLRDQGIMEFIQWGDTIFAVYSNGYLMVNDIMRMERHSAVPVACGVLTHGSIGMTSTGTLCTCTTGNVWRNAANTANCVW